MPTHVNIITYMDDLVKFSEKNKNILFFFIIQDHGTKDSRIKKKIVPIRNFQ